MATRRTPGTRAKDSDRTETCQVLDGALAEGQLSMEEHRQRVSTATHATTLGELWPLVTDLQTANPVQPLVTQPSKLPRGPVVTAAGMAAVIDEIRKRFGDTMGYELAITPDEAILARPDPTNDHSKLIYSFMAAGGTRPPGPGPTPTTWPTSVLSTCKRRRPARSA